MPSSPNTNEKRYCVYCHTLRSDGRRYIGITGRDPKKRWSYGAGYGNTHFGCAIRKYGWDAFEHEILISGLTEEEAKQEEIRLIALYKSNNKRYGFNLTNGGEGVTGLKFSEESKKRLRESHLGKKLSPESKKRQSESLKEYYKTHEPPVRTEEHMRKLQEGRRKTPGWKNAHPFSEEAKQKLRDANLGKKASIETRLKMRDSAKKKAVIAKDMDGNIVSVYISIRDASRTLGREKSSSRIVECCEGKRQKYLNLKWEYYEQ